ncbi:MAG: DUF362 domain-containing protein [Thermoanaerobaculales bacterium]|jgi:hypothetical protein|nr:DUF362 domain-containing protein [Thermoanaerobaculales bacterium]
MSIDHPTCPGRHEHPSPSTRGGPLRRWFLANSLLAGVLALVWLVLRSGPKPSRLAYPCQQASLSAATLALGAPLVAAVVAVRRQLVSGLATPFGLAAAVVAVAAGLAVTGVLVVADPQPGVVAVDPPRDYRAAVFHVSGCPEDPVGDAFPGLDALLGLMGTNGLQLHRSSIPGPISGPDGLIAADDVVLVKINYQWGERGGTNTDLLRGLLLRITEHPEGFTGEIVIVENTQFAGADNFDRAANNAQDHGQSPRDVVDDLAGLGVAVSLFDWTAIRHTPVAEYSAGDLADGYVVYPYDPGFQGRVSYPKFRTDLGTYISLRDGVWDLPSSTYDRNRLKVVNLPVLKSHHSTYGATACVKNWMGVITTGLSTNSHSAMRYGILGQTMVEVRPADLNILDAIWINADPYTGPATTYAGATRRDELVASTDPVAADIWAVTNILIPGFLGNGFTPPWPQPDATPDDPSSDFRQYLDASMAALLNGGYQTTNDLGQIDLYSLDAGGALFDDGFESGTTSAWSSTSP